ncbi:MAG: hypothetical protein PGN25_01405 [Methylorubrum populi]
MTSRLSRSAVFAATFATLGLAAGGALTQSALAQAALPAPMSPPAAASLGYTASPLDGQGYAVAPREPLTVMGTTGGIEPKQPEATGSISRHPIRAPRARAH